ncbi:MAG: hypothetical protein V2I33_04740 [Kangiellaceae bacterium]|jgi:hypothetical protein|nr:hypothetical protein [Kangiellaceae bacterium]
MEASVKRSASTLDKWFAEWRIKPANSEKIKWLRGYGTPRAETNGDIVWNSVILDVTEEKEAKVEMSLRLLA